MMKVFITLLLVTVLAITVRTAVIKDVSRYNLSAGYIGAGDRLLYRGYLYREAIPNSIQYQDLIFNGNYSARISAVQAFEVGYTQYASAWILRGGIGTNNVTVRVQSARGYGYYYTVEIWGR